MSILFNCRHLVYDHFNFFPELSIYIVIYVNMIYNHVQFRRLYTVQPFHKLPEETQWTFEDTVIMLLVPAMFTPSASLVSVVLSSSCVGVFSSLHWEMMKT